jgi:peroxiredoxin
MKFTEARRRARAWQKKYDVQAPGVGDIAPDFQLYDAQGNKCVRLSDYRGKKPVAMIFGSFT